MRPMIADSYLRCGWRDELLALRKVHVRFVGTPGAALGMRRRRGTRRSDARPATTRDDLDVGIRRELVARLRLRVRVPIRRQLAASMSRLRLQTPEPPPLTEPFPQCRS